MNHAARPLAPKARPPQIVSVSVLLLALAAGCGDRSGHEAPAAAATASPKLGASQDLPRAARAMRVTSEMTLRVADLGAGESEIRAAVDAAGGYVASAQSRGDGAARRVDLELKIPSDKLAEVRRALVGSGDIESESQKAEDVTDQQVDLKARVRNARAEEKRLIDLLSDRTGSLSDVLAAEKSLAEVRERIERLEAADATLDREIAFASLKLHLAPKAVAEPSTALGRVESALERGVSITGQLVVGTGVVLATVAPTLVVLGLCAWSIWVAARAVGRVRTRLARGPA